jgi:hypothetical protein
MKLKHESLSNLKTQIGKHIVEVCSKGIIEVPKFADENDGDDFFMRAQASGFEEYETSEDEEEIKEEPKKEEPKKEEPKKEEPKKEAPKKEEAPSEDTEEKPKFFSRKKKNK